MRSRTGPSNSVTSSPNIPFELNSRRAFKLTFYSNVRSKFKTFFSLETSQLICSVHFRSSNWLLNFDRFDMPPQRSRLYHIDVRYVARRFFRGFIFVDRNRINFYLHEVNHRETKATLPPSLKLYCPRRHYNIMVRVETKVARRFFISPPHPSQRSRPIVRRHDVRAVV